MKSKKILLSVFAISIFLSACSSTADPVASTREFEAAVETALAETQAALPSPLPTGTPPPATPIPLISTNTSLPILSTYTPIVAPPTQPTVIVPTATPLCYQGTFVSETVPDGTVVKPGEVIRKTWEIKNTGTCEWTSNFRWIFVAGDPMKGTTNRSIPGGPYQPGDTMSITINLTSPLIPGTYRATYKMQDAKGNFFTQYGFWVEIVVVKPTDTP